MKRVREIARKREERMGWTREKPKEAGWYWYREDGEFLYAVKVRDDLTVIFPGNECEFTMAELGDQEWQGPIRPED